jgi:hypothetical protein
MRALTLTFAGALLLSTSALADTTWMQRVDLNGDGVVTPAEAQRHEYLVIAELDKNNDGVITQSEWNKRPDFKFEYADFDSNGVLTPTEIHNGYVSGFRYNGVATVPGYPTAYATTTTNSYPEARVYTYTYYPSGYQGALTPPVAAVPAAPVIVQPQIYVPPEQGYILRGPVQQPVYAPQPNYAPQPSYSYNPQPAYGVTVMSDSQLAYGDLAPGNPFALDVNRDGALTIAEVLRYNDWNFQRHDKDGNGWVDAYEWDLKAQEHFGHRVNPVALGTLSHDTFNRHDRDNDGRISKTEWDRQIEAEFVILDGNNDGMLHPGDFQLASN